MATKTDPPEQTTADGDGQADDDKTGGPRNIDERFKKLEAEQASQGSKLDKILELLPGSSSHSSSDDDASDDDASEPTQRHNIGAEVRRQIADAEARRKADEKEAGLTSWQKSVDEQLEKLRPEKPPRPPLSRLQRLMFGRDE